MFICSIWSNPNTVGVIFPPLLSHPPSLHERTAPHCSPDNFGKGVRWDEKAEREDEDKGWRISHGPWRSRGARVVWSWGREGSTAVNWCSFSISSRLTRLCFVGVYLIYSSCDIVVCGAWFFWIIWWNSGKMLHKLLRLDILYAPW